MRKQLPCFYGKVGTNAEIRFFAGGYLLFHLIHLLFFLRLTNFFLIFPVDFKYIH